MPKILEHVARLSQQIGPRPAGTEEEQQAALYISEQLQKEANLPTAVEDFATATGSEALRTICCFASVVFAALSLFLPVLAVPAIIVTLLSAAFFACEALDKPVLSKFFARGVSQNVVAKYEPGYSPDGAPSRRRKVVLVARYDSGKVQAELKGSLLDALPFVRKAELAAMVLLPVVLIIRNVVFPHATGAAAVAFTVISIVLLVFAALPLVGALVHKVAAYNDGANCNASGVAVLLDVAARVGHSHAEGGEMFGNEGNPLIHGEGAARASGLVPEGARLVYEAGAMEPPDFADQSPEMRLAAAKAAVAALSGKPVTSAPYDISSQLVQVKDAPLAAPTSDDVSAMRAETREAFVSVPAGTVDEALANAAARGGSAHDAGVVSSWFGSEFDDEEVAGEVGFETRADGVQEFSSAGAAPVAVAGAAVAADVVATSGAAPSGVVPFGASAPAGASVFSPAADDGVPDWFKKAQEKAKRTKDDGVPVQRSRYADALDAALQETFEHSSDAAQAGSQAESQGAPQVGFQARSQSALQGASIEDQQRFRQEGAGLAEARDFEARPQRSSEEAGAESTTGQASFNAQADGSAFGACTFGEDAGAFAPEQESDADACGQSRDAAEPFTVPAFLRERAARDRGEVAGRTMNRVEVSAVSSSENAAPSISEHAHKALEIPNPMTSTVEAGEQVAFVESDKPAGRRAITLPSIGATSALPPLAEMQKQRAPLAEAAESGKPNAKSLLNTLPSIDLGSPEASMRAGEGEGAGDEAASASWNRSALRNSLPSLSGAISSRGSFSSSSGEDKEQVGSVSFADAGLTGSFVAGATGAFAPVSEELLQNVDPSDIYVDDADDSGYEGRVTETGAFAGPGYVDMPKSRAHRLFGKFRFGKNKKNDEETPQEWLHVDESFDARSVGAARGGWESFQQDDDQPELGSTQAFPVYDANEEPAEGKKRRWHGGAFSRRMMGKSQGGHEERIEDAHEEDVYEEGSYEDYGDYEGYEEAGYEGAPEGELGTVPSAAESIRRFRYASINTEVWFVALGSELAKNGGMNAFLAEHSQDLRGAIIIELEGMGAGELSFVEREGAYKTVFSSSRMRRYVKKASQALAMDVPSVQLCWKNGAAAQAVKHGFQAMHLAGMDGSKPAFYAQADDVLENIDEEKMLRNSDFVMELLKNI